MSTIKFFKYILLFLLVSFNSMSYANGNGYFGGEKVAKYCHFNIPFYMSYLGKNSSSVSFFYPGLASLLGQIQYTKRLTKTSKWGIGLGVLFIALYGEKEFTLKNNKKINTSLLMGGPLLFISAKTFLHFDQTGKYQYGGSVNYIFYSGKYGPDFKLLFMVPYPGSQVVSINYEGLITSVNNGPIDLFFSIGANYLCLSYIGNKNQLYSFSPSFVDLSDHSFSNVSWEKRICWNASIGFNF